MKRFFITLIALLLVSSAYAGLKPYQGGITPPLALTDILGKNHNLADYRGKVVLVQFWATYCTPCRKEMPSMNRLIQKMDGTPFVILAVNMGESQQEVARFIDQVGPRFPILMDPEGGSIDAWKVFAAPSNFLIGADGRIHYTLYGGVEWDADEMVALLKGLAKQ